MPWLRTLLALCMVPLIALGMAWFSGISLPLSCLWSLPIGAVVWLTSLGLHELAHICVGRVVGVRVGHIEVGRGPRLVRLRLRGVVVDVSATPLETFSMWWSPHRNGLRWRLGLMYLAGPTMTAGLCWVALHGTAHDMADGTPFYQFADGVTFWNNLLVANVWILAVALSPINALRKRWPRSDADKLISYLKMSAQGLEDHRDSGLVSAINKATEMKAYGDAAAMVDAALRVTPDDEPLHYMRGVVAACANEPERAEVCFRRVIAAVQTSEGLRAEVQWNLAWMMFGEQNEAHRDEAALLAVQALAVKPDNINVQRTHGAILGWQGEHQRSIDLVLPNFAISDRADERAEIAACLALNFAALGDLPAADHWLAQGNAQDPGSRLLSTASAYVTTQRWPFQNEA